jgi:hypothetical protein
MASNTKTLIDAPKELSGEKLNIFWDTVDAVLTKEDYTRMYTEEYNKLQSGENVFSEQERKNIIEQLGGAGAKLEDGKIINNGQTILEDVSEEYL